MSENTDPIAQQAAWLEQSAGFRVLDEIALLALLGEDAAAWINGQVTNDLRDLKKDRAGYALVTNVKGRILADLWAIREGEDVLALVPKEAVEVLLPHFDKYIIMEDVEIEPSEERALISVQGPRAAELVGSLEGPEGTLRFTCDRLGKGGLDLVVPRSELDAVRAELGEAAHALGGGEVSEEAWDLARIRAGRPRFGVDFGDKSYPQEAGLRDLAISFSKGCYLGQEVVCMLENRGRLVRRLALFDLAEAAEAEAELAKEDGTVVGRITSSSPEPSTGRALGLGYVKVKAVESEEALSVGGKPVRMLRYVGE
jgi:folate-binding protein YgfZ